MTLHFCSCHIKIRLTSLSKKTIDILHLRDVVGKQQQQQNPLVLFLQLNSCCAYSDSTDFYLSQKLYNHELPFVHFSFWDKAWRKDSSIVAAPL